MNGTCFHDKECDEVHRIPTESLEAVEEMPDLEVCPKCQWKIYLRKACYPNHKQIGICEKILKDHNVSVKKLRHCVIEVGMKFHATSLEEMTVEGKEDTWIIKGLQNKQCTLWHNNYVKTSPTERYITEGFHRQKLSNKTLSQVLYYIEDYSFIKHLEMEKRNIDDVNERAVDVLDKVASANEIEQNNRYEENRLLRVLKKGVEKMKKLFDILFDLYSNNGTKNQEK